MKEFKSQKTPIVKDVVFVRRPVGGRGFFIHLNETFVSTMPVSGSNE